MCTHSELPRSPRPLGGGPQPRWAVRALQPLPGLALQPGREAAVLVCPGAGIPFLGGLNLPVCPGTASCHTGPRHEPFMLPSVPEPRFPALPVSGLWGTHPLLPPQ